MSAFYRALLGMVFVLTVLALIAGEWGWALHHVGIGYLIYLLGRDEQVIKMLREQTGSWQRGYFDGMRVALGNPKFAAHKIETEDSDDEV